MVTIYQVPETWEDWISFISAGIDGRSRWRFAPVLLGILFAAGRRCVSTWLRAAGNSVRQDYQNYYYFLQTLGRDSLKLGLRIMGLVIIKLLHRDKRVVLAIDDTPTKRYGKHVEGAGIHHDPTPGPTGKEFCYGHVWVTLAVLVQHPLWGIIGLPIWSWLYVRENDVSKLPAKYHWQFQTKLTLAAELVLEAHFLLQKFKKEVWCVADGAYTRQEFIRPLITSGVKLVGRLRKDAALFDLPVNRSGQRGRKCKYGKHKLSLAKRAGQSHGWQQVECEVYGKQRIKLTKTFLATSKIFPCIIRVVIVKEEHGCCYFFCTDTTASVQMVIETFASRAAIEQVFHDVKEVWGSGEQQVRNLWSSIGVWHLNLWMFTMVELWCWDKTHAEIVHRKNSPWDDETRRPSHADRRKTLQSQCLMKELTSLLPKLKTRQKIQNLLARLAGLRL